MILTVPNAMPALPHGAMKDAVSSCGYTFLFNMVSSALINIQYIGASILLNYSVQLSF